MSLLQRGRFKTSDAFQWWSDQEDADETRATKIRALKPVDWRASCYRREVVAGCELVSSERFWVAKRTIAKWIRHDRHFNVVPDCLEGIEQPERKFARLANAWRRETALMSSVHSIVLHPAYQAIIGMGPVALSLILSEMARRPGHWFWALHAISGEDPTSPGQTFDEAVESWLTWGRNRRLI